MLDDEFQGRIKSLLQAVETRTSWVSIAIITVIGVAVGCTLHNYVWRANDLSYAVTRSEILASECEGLPLSRMRTLTDNHIGKPRRHFTIGDQLAALDYVFDNIHAMACVAKK